MPAPAILVLEDGRTFRGESYGAEGETFGEAVFNTGMTGYQETLTDPSYHRQVVVMTAPHIGNTGVNDEDARVVEDLGGRVRRPRPGPGARPAGGRRRSLDDELQAQGVVGISGIDTRALTRHLRERGAMRVGISSTETDPSVLLEPGPRPGPDGRRRARQRGVDGGDLRRARDRGEEAHRGRPRPRHQGDDPAPDGRARHRGARAAGHRDPRRRARGRRGRAVLQQRAGRPGRHHVQVELLQDALADGIPYFGICFGNQLFGRALGFGTYKLKYGHRGINQPVMDRTTGKVEVTAHNHGFAVDAPLDEATETPYGVATVSHVCLNDDVVEGLELRSPEGALKAFSVQYHPEAAAGPHDAAYLFDRFVSLMSEPPRTEPAKDEGEARRLRSVGEGREPASGPRDASKPGEPGLGPDRGHGGFRDRR